MKGYCHLEAIRLIGLFLPSDLLSSLSNSLRYAILHANPIAFQRAPWKHQTRNSFFSNQP